MALFSFHFDRPGPGVEPDAPRKKGFARFWEVLTRDLGSFYMAGLLALLSGMPYALGVAYAIMTHALLPLIAAGFLGGMLAAPQLCGLNDTILRSLRDEPGYWWNTYRRAWKQNAAAALAPGGVCGLVLAFALFALVHLGPAAGLVELAVLLLCLVLITGLGHYIFLQIPLMDFSFGALLKNAALLFLGFLPRTGLALLFLLGYWLAVALFLPYSVFAMMLTGLWLPALASALAVYPALDKVFSLEEKLRAMREAQLADALDTDAAALQNGKDAQP